MSEVLAAAPLMAVLPRDFPLPADGVIRPQTLEGAPFVSLDLGLQARFLIDQAFFSAKVSRRLMVETSLSHVACDLVAAGAGVSLVDPLTAPVVPGQGPARPPVFPPRSGSSTTSFVPHRCRPPCSPSASSCICKTKSSASSAQAGAIRPPSGDRSVFLYGLGKNERDNIDDIELAD